MRPGSFIITWVVPISIVAKLKANIPRHLLKRYCVIKLEIGGSCVYDVYSDVSVRDKHSHAPAEAIDNLPLKNAVRQRLESSKELNLLIVGCYHVGKSTLINSLFFKKGEKYEPKAAEGSLKACTQEVRAHTLIMDGVCFNIYDSPGLQDDSTAADLVYLSKIKATCPNIHLVIYCKKMEEPIRPAEKTALKNLHKAFGSTIWDNAVIALTFANKVDPPDPYTDEVEYFSALKTRNEEEFYGHFRSFIIKELFFENLKTRIHPVGSAKVLQLRGMEKDWRAEFWYGCIEACREEGKGAVLKIAWKDAAFVAKVFGAVIVGTAAVTTVGILISKGVDTAAVTLTGEGVRTAAVATVGILTGKGLHAEIKAGVHAGINAGINAGIFLVAASIGTLLGMRDTTGGAIAINGTTEEMDEQERKKQ